MQFLAVDDEHLALSALVSALEEICPDSQIHSFSGSGPALAALADGLRPDVAFLDVEMPELHGLELAKQLKCLSPKTMVIFVTGHAQYALDAFAIHARGYLLKPVRTDRLHAELNALWEPSPPVTGSLLRVQCFGNFEVFFGGAPLAFPRSKSKELLAYLIHRRGGSCTVREIAAVLFEDREYNISLLNQVQTIISAMLKTLASIGARDVVIRKFNSLSVDMGRVDCDFYRFLDGDPKAINAYTGDYMSNYAWSMFLTGYLDERLNREPSPPTP